MAKKTIQRSLIEELASEKRVVAADWRIHVLHMRIAKREGYAFPSRARILAEIRAMEESDLIREIPDVRGVFRVVVPYASTIPVSDEVIVQEANPTAVFSHATAFAYHGLTNEIPSDIHVSETLEKPERLPLSSSPDDWTDIPEPQRRRPLRVESRKVHWSRIKKEWDFGETVGYLQGNPIYVTNLERTLLDAIRFPDKCGGLSQVFSAWKNCVEDCDIDRLLNYADRFNQNLLRQRVGFVLEKLGIRHPRLENWTTMAKRGSSAKLSASEQFSPVHSERWCLSLNTPPSILSILEPGS